MSPEILQALEKIGGGAIAVIVLWGVYRIVKHLIDKLAQPLVDSLTKSWSRLEASQTAHAELLLEIRDSLVRIEASEANEAEERRFMRENFQALLANLTKLVNNFQTFRGENVFRDEMTGEIHTMVTDVHRETVQRPTGIHRREEIERKKRERDSR